MLPTHDDQIAIIQYNSISRTPRKLFHQFRAGPSSRLIAVQSASPGRDSRDGNPCPLLGCTRHSVVVMSLPAASRVHSPVPGHDIHRGTPHEESHRGIHDHGNHRVRGPGSCPAGWCAWERPNSVSGDHSRHRSAAAHLQIATTEHTFV